MATRFILFVFFSFILNILIVQYIARRFVNNNLQKSWPNFARIIFIATSHQSLFHWSFIYYSSLIFEKASIMFFNYGHSKQCIINTSLHYALFLHAVCWAFLVIKCSRVYFRFSIAIVQAFSFFDIRFECCVSCLYLSGCIYCIFCCLSATLLSLNSMYITCEMMSYT